MKKYLLLIAADFSVTTAFSQTHFYMNFGYNLGYAKLGGLNYVVDRYNETRTWLTDDMDDFHLPNGFCASLGGSNRKLMFDLTWVGRHMTRSAGGPQPTNGKMGQREIKWRFNTFNFGLGVALGKTKYSRVNIGVSFDFGTEKVFTRVGEEGVFNPEEFQEVEKELMLGSTLFMQIILSPGIPGALFIRPYVQFPYFGTNVGNAAYNINSATYQNDDITMYDSNSWNAGVQLQIGLFGSRED